MQRRYISIKRCSGINELRPKGDDCNLELFVVKNKNNIIWTRVSR